MFHRPREPGVAELEASLPPIAKVHLENEGKGKEDGGGGNNGMPNTKTATLRVSYSKF